MSVRFARDRETIPSDERPKKKRGDWLPVGHSVVIPLMFIDCCTSLPRLNALVIILHIKKRLFINLSLGILEEGGARRGKVLENEEEVDKRRRGQRDRGRERHCNKDIEKCKRQ